MSVAHGYWPPLVVWPTAKYLWTRVVSFHPYQLSWWNLHSSPIANMGGGGGYVDLKIFNNGGGGAEGHLKYLIVNVWVGHNGGVDLKMGVAGYSIPN